MSEKKIVVDIYGGDNGPETVIRGAINTLSLKDDFRVVFAGDRKTAENTVAELKKTKDFDESRIEYIDAPGQITNNDSPMAVVKAGGTSMNEALKFLKSDEDAVGLVSCGSTGSLLVGSIFLLGLTAGLKMPALCSLLPTGKNNRMICLTDCGSNIDCKPEELVLFAKLGAELVTKTFGWENPKVGLMSVGKEDHKGNTQTKAAFGLLKESGLNFVGNVEPDALYSGEADVIVCDGFPGNILLKNTEAAGHNILAKVLKIREEEKDPHTQEILDKVCDEIIKSHEFNQRGGAIFLGTKKSVVKAHGSATDKTIFACISQILGIGEVPM